jgi:hypothetical protein
VIRKGALDEITAAKQIHALQKRKDGGKIRRALTCSWIARLIGISPLREGGPVSWLCELLFIDVFALVDLASGLKTAIGLPISQRLSGSPALQALGY